MEKVALIILDGYGEGKAYPYNAVINAKTPNLDKLRQNGYSLIKTDGEAVGLFKGDMGGSEVGHTTIGAGRIVPSTAKLIDDEIVSKEFDKNKTIVSMLKHLKENKSNLHLFGLMSDKKIHSDINHLYHIIDLAKDYAKQIFIHFVTDGRDSGPFDSLKYLKQLKNHIKNIKNCSILSVSGRFYAMDRENYLDRTNLAYNAMFGGQNVIKEVDIESYIKSQHKNGKNDQYIQPIHIANNGYMGVNKKDALFFFNFREDRLRQIVKKCEDLDCDIVTMSNVADTKAKVVYSHELVKNTLSEYLSQNNLTQIKISETTKYAHVTYFLNGGRELPFKNETRVHIPTIETDDYAKTPKMRAKEITNEIVKAFKTNYDVVIANFSNPDMLGHTGNYKATVKAIEYLDKCIGKIVRANKDYKILITADHGNSEEMMTVKNEPHTAHTLNKVMFLCVDKDIQLKKSGELQDVAPTMLDLIGLKPNPDFTGKSLVVKK